MNRIERLTAIVLLLQERSYTSTEIARYFEVSKRTILRDIQGLSEMGVPIIAQAGSGGGYSLTPGYSLAPLALTERESFLLLFALNAMTKLNDTPFAPERSSLLAKLHALLPTPAPLAVEQWLAVAEIEMPERQQRAYFLEALLEAAQEGRWVEISYQSAERLSIQHLLPRQLTTQNSFWYCRAYAYEHQAERTYRVDRIQSLEYADKSFLIMPAQDEESNEEATQLEVIVSLTPKGAAIVESEPHMGKYLRRKPDTSGELVFRCPPDDLGWHARFFASLGSDAEVHAPAELRQRITQLAHKLLQVYGG